MDSQSVAFRRKDGYRIHYIDDGVDYWWIVDGFRKGTLPGEKLPSDRGEVYKVVFQNREYVLKFEIDPRFRLKLLVKYLIFTETSASDLLKKTARAAARGCTVFQKIFLVADSRIWTSLRETIYLCEYVPGHTLAEESDIAAFKSNVLSVMLDLHCHGLGHRDAHPGNFVVMEDSFPTRIPRVTSERGEGVYSERERRSGSLKAIDITFRSSIHTVNKARDILQLKEIYDIELLPDSVAVKMYLKWLTVYEQWRKRIYPVKRMLNRRR
jgi:hypothetical protein